MKRISLSLFNQRSHTQQKPFITDAPFVTMSVHCLVAWITIISVLSHTPVIGKYCLLFIVSFFFLQ